MPLPTPPLDERTFEQLLAAARARVEQSNAGWTDLSPSDPGVVLLELFAYLTEQLIGRLNQLPERAYVEFLRLLGVTLLPPSAAAVTLRFSRKEADEQVIEIPRGTRVTVGRGDGDGEPPVFVTTEPATLAAGQTEAEAPALNCELVEAELVGKGTGRPGLVVYALHPPLIAPTGDGLDLRVGVEAMGDELDGRVPVEQHGGKLYRVWREVRHFTNLGNDPYVYVADRVAGSITFAPAVQLEQEDGRLAFGQGALGAIPAEEREIRLWYRRGGGTRGNVAAGTLTSMRDAVAGIEVTNQRPAAGGQDTETLENALLRGPQQLHSLDRAVTARDFEQLARTASRAVARARAITEADLWTHATPGSVELLLVPDVPETARPGGRVSIEELRAREDPLVAEQQVGAAIEQRRPLGTACRVNWARYKPVRVDVRVIARRAENLPAVRERVLERLHRTLNPLPSELLRTGGWPFGQALRASHIYDIVLAEPGVLVVDDIRLTADQAPTQDIESLAADRFQRDTWYAGSGATLFRSLNNGHGWEPVGVFPGEQIQIVEPHPDEPGWVAAVTRFDDGRGYALHVSRDCGESWWEAERYTTAFAVHDLAWIERDPYQALLVATERGLYEIALGAGSGPVPLLVDPADPDLGYYAIAATRDIFGQVQVAVGAQRTRGVYLSAEAGRSQTFRHIGLANEDIRRLAIQREGPHAYLWAGAFTAGEDTPGAGLSRWRLLGTEDPPEGWHNYRQGWSGGSCYGLAFLGTTVVAGTHRSGVLTLALDGAQEPSWVEPDINAGLPLRDRVRFHRVLTVAADTAGGLILAGGEEGVFRSDDGGRRYSSVSQQEFADNVTLPPTWLFCSGEHNVTVVSADAR